MTRGVVNSMSPGLDTAEEDVRTEAEEEKHKLQGLSWKDSSYEALRNWQQQPQHFK